MANKIRVQCTTAVGTIAYGSPAKSIKIEKGFIEVDRSDMGYFINDKRFKIISSIAVTAADLEVLTPNKEADGATHAPTPEVAPLAVVKGKAKGKGKGKGK